MIISDEQVRRAVAYLRAHDRNHTHATRTELPEALVQRVREVLEALPETREERVTEARDRLEGDMPSADEIAAKIIGRSISDSLR